MPDLVSDLSPASSDARRAPRIVAFLFTWSGLAPLGAFLVLHLAMNASALHGGRAFDGTVDALHRFPALPLFESLVVFAPLLFHGALGTWLVATRRSLAAAPYARPWRMAMRATGVIALAFLLVHLPELRFAERGARLGGGELGTLLDAHLSATAFGVPWRGLAYLVGTAAVTFHFVCGLWGAFARARAASTKARQRVAAAWAAGVLGAFMWVAFADVIVLRATGARLVAGTVGAAASEVLDSNSSGCVP